MTVSTTSAAPTEPTASASSASTAVEPMNLKIPLTGVVALLLQGLMAVGAHCHESLEEERNNAGERDLEVHGLHCRGGGGG